MDEIADQLRNVSCLLSVLRVLHEYDVHLELPDTGLVRAKVTVLYDDGPETPYDARYSVRVVSDDGLRATGHDGSSIVVALAQVRWSELGRANLR